MKIHASLWKEKLCCYSVLCGTVLAMLFLLTLFFATFVIAAQVTLEWDPNSEPDLAGYKIYYGTSSENYDMSVDVGNWTSCTIAGFEEGATYYFAATAYDAYGNESDFSEEVSTTIPHYAYSCDLNSDGVCDIKDLQLFTQDWGRDDCGEPAVECKCDLNQDGKCDMQDWLIFSPDWGTMDYP